MTVSVESWNTLRAYSPRSGCTGALGDLARAGDVASLANALEAGIAPTGDPGLKAERFAHMMALLTTDNLPSSERAQAEEVVEQWYRQMDQKAPALLVLGSAAENPLGSDPRIDFLVKIGVDPYERVHKDGYTRKDETEFYRDESAVECMLRIAVDTFRTSDQFSASEADVMILANQLLGSGPVTSPADLPMRVNLNNAIEEREGGAALARFVDMDVLSAAAALDLPVVVQSLRDRIDTQRYPETQEVYYRMGDLALKLMGISFDGTGAPTFEPAVLEMAFTESDYQIANHLVAHGAQFRQGRAGLEAVVGRPVDRSYSAPFMAAHSWGVICRGIEAEQRYLQRMLDEGIVTVASRERDGTILSCAVAARSADMVEFLIERGSDARDVSAAVIESISPPIAREVIADMLRVGAARAAIDEVVGRAKLRPAGK